MSTSFFMLHFHIKYAYLPIFIFVVVFFFSLVIFLHQYAYLLSCKHPFALSVTHLQQKKQTVYWIATCWIQSIISVEPTALTARTALLLRSQYFQLLNSCWLPYCILLNISILLLATHKSMYIMYCGKKITLVACRKFDDTKFEVYDTLRVVIYFVE